MVYKSFLRGVICAINNERLLGRAIPLTLYYTPRLMNEILIEIKETLSCCLEYTRMSLVGLSGFTLL
jgi:hypothetical protein